jgi:two-component system sensor histidine kinase AdeS
VIRTATFGAFARISIEDSGPGIDADRAAHIFQPFKRDPSATGSGLGLAVVRAIAEAHGGLALHRNTVAGGSLFTLEIPRQPARRPPV